MTAPDLSTARLLWQTGDWPALARQPVAIPGRGSATPEQIERALYRLQALSLTGATDEARRLSAALQAGGVSRQALGRALLSGAGSALARARLINGQSDLARHSLARAIALNPEAGDTALVQAMRFENEQRRLAAHHTAPPARLPYIDVIGPSGSGKTTLLKALAKREGLAPLSKPDPSRIAANDASQKMFGFMLAHPEFVRSVSEALASTHESERLKVFLEDVLFRYLSATPVAGTLYLFDEGFVCRANSLFAYADGLLDEDAVRRYLQSIPIPLALVMLQEHPDTCMGRLVTRPKGLPQRMQTMKNHERTQALQKMARISIMAGEALREIGVPVIQISPGMSVEEATERVITALTEERLHH